MLPPSSSAGTWAIALLLSTFTSAAPLIIAAMGGVLSERSGVVNIALEGLILAGAFMGVWAGQRSPLAGLAGALAVGALLGLLHAYLTQITNMDHVVSGLGITLFASGATHYLFQRYLRTGVSIGGLPEWPFVAGAVVLPFLVHLMISRTPFGLRLRAVGENPESARMAGVAPLRVRFVAVTLSGVLGALAGAFLSMAGAHRFSPDMSAGKGYIALAAVIFGKWNALGAAFGALFFGFFDALQSQLQISHIRLHWLGVEWTNPYLLQTLPYLMTLAALVTVVGRSTPPASLGVSEQG